MKERRDINELIFLVQDLIEQARNANSINDRGTVDALLVSVEQVLAEVKVLVNKE